MQALEPKNDPLDHHPRAAALSPADDRGFSVLAIVLQIFCLVPFLTGAADIFGGAKFLQTAGAALPSSTLLDPILNNQIKFWGVIWFGYGLSLWWASLDLLGRTALLRIILGTLFVSGLGRALSVYQYGWASAVLTGAMGLELIGSPLLLAWHQRLIRKR